MWDAGAIAFRGQFETRVNRAAELRSGVWRERYGGVGGGRALGPSCKVGRGRKDGSVGVNVYIVIAKVHVILKLGVYIYARTIARMW